MTTYDWGTNSGLWSVDTNWTPTGVPSAATDQAFITAPGAYTITVDPRTFLLDSLVLNDAAAELDVGGTLDFAGVDNSLALDAGTLVLEAGGVIQGATIQSAGGTLTSDSGTLDGVTYQGELDLTSGYALTVQDVTVQSAAGTLPGTIVFAYNSTLNVSGGLTVGASGNPGSIQMAYAYDNLYFNDSETLDNAVVTISGSGDVIDSVDSTLTLGAGTTVDLSGSNDFLYDNIINLGSVGVTGGSTYLADYSTASTFDNQGILSLGNAILYVDNSTFTNEGSIDVGGGGVLVNNSPSFSNAGTVTIEAGGLFAVQSTIGNTGTITVDSGGAMELKAALSNTGTITVESGGTLDIQYPLALTDLEALPITIMPGATLEISGSLDLGGGILDMAPSGAFGNVVLSSGTIAHGTIFLDGGSFALAGSANLFDGITYQGELDLTDSASLQAVEGLTVEGAAGTPPGTVVFGTGSSLSISGGLTVGAPGSPGSIQMATSFDALTCNDTETLYNAAITISGYDDNIDATVYVLTFGPDTTVDLSGSSDYLYDNITNLGSIGVTGGTATFANNYVGGTFDNQGSISVDNATLSVSDSSFINESSIDVGGGGLLSIGSPSFSNTGTITVESGGTLQLYSPLTDAGTIVVQSGGTLDLQENFALSDLVGSGITIQPGATLEISGSLDLGGGILDMVPSGAFGSIVLAAGTIADGTIFLDAGSFALNSSGTFDGITYQGELDITASANLTVLDGLTVESAAGTLPGAIVFGSSSGLNVSGGLTVGTAGGPGSIQMGNGYDYLNFSDPETLYNAAIAISGYDASIGATVYTLTLGSDTTIDLSGTQDYLYDSITNLGSIGVTGGYAYFANDQTSSSTFDNQGSLSVSNATLYVSNGTFSNEGSIDVGGGGLLDISSPTFTNGGTATVESGGTLELFSPLTNAGSIVVQSGGTLDLQDYVTPPDLLAAGITIEPGGTLEISGTLDLGGGTLDIAATGPFSNLVLTSGGTIENGTIVPDSGSLTLGSGSTLYNITYRGELDIPDNTTLTFANGLTVESAAGTLPGTIVFGTNSGLDVSGGLTVGASGSPGSIQMANASDSIFFYDSETLDNAVVTLSGNNDSIDAYVYTLTLGAGAMVDLSGPQDYLYDSITNLGSIGVTGGYAYATQRYSAASTFDNQGSLSVDNGTLYVENSTFSNEGSIDVGSGGLLYINAGSVTNGGTVTVESGGTVELYSPLTNTGTAIIQSGGTLDLQDSVTLSQLQGPGLTIEPGGTLEISGTLDLGGGTLDIAATGPFSNLVLTSGGTIANGTILPNDGGTLTLQGGTLDNVTHQGELDIPDNTTLTFENGVTVESAAGTLPGAIVFGTGSQLDVSGGLTVGATGTPGSIQMANFGDTLFFYDSETLDNAAVTLSGNSDYIEAYVYTLALGADTTVDMSGSGDALYDSITNLGSIGVTGGTAYASQRYSAASTFDNQGSLSVDNATLYVENSTFSNEGSIDVGSGGLLYIDAGSFTSADAILVGAGGTLEIVTATSADVTYNDPATLILDNPTTYTGTLSGFSVGDVLQLTGQDVADASISGTTLTVDLVGGGTLTYTTGPGYDGGGFVVSQGTDGNQDRLTYVGNTAGAFVWNASVGSGFWSVPGNWTPNGVPDAATAKADIIQPGTYTVTVDPTTTFTLDAAILDNADAELDVQGTLNFAGADNTLALIDGTLMLENGGTIQGATIQSDGGTLASAGGVLDAVTWQGELDLPANSALFTQGGFTVEGAGGTLPGTIVFAVGSALYIANGLTVGATGSPGSIQLETNYDDLVVYGTETLDHAAITISGAYDYVYAASGTVLTLGADTTVSLSGNPDYLYGDIVNAGSIGVTGGATYALDYGAADTFDNKGTLTVANAAFYVQDSAFTNEGSIDVGGAGLLVIDSSTFTSTGTLTVESGGTLDLQYALTLTQLEGAGITIEPGGLLEISGTLDLQGGTLDIAASGLLGNVLLVGGGTIANGTIHLDGGTLNFEYGTLSAITYRGELDVNASTGLTVTGGLTVESAAGALPGTIALEYGSSLYVTGGLTVGTPASPGSIQLETNYDNLQFGDSETVDNAAFTLGGTNETIEAYTNTVTFGAATTVTSSGATDDLFGNFINAGSFDVTGGTTYAQNYSGPSTFDNKGSLNVTGGSLTIENGTFSNEGQVSIGSGGYLDVATTTFTSATAFLIHSGGTLEIAPATAVDITYNDPALAILDNPATYTGTFAGLAVGDQLQLDGENVANASIAGGTLTANLVGGGTLTFHADPALNGTPFSIGTGSDGAQDLLTAEAIPCFLPGTQIRTTRGDVAVEHLAVGDTVITLGGRHRLLCWIGRGSALATRGRRTAATPLIVRKGALADNVPNRDLRITKGHSLFLDDVLIPVEFLVNHRSILWDDVTQQVTVFHLELDEHDILIANGAAAESYRDDGNRWLFRNANSGWDQPAKPPCAPVLTGGPIVDAAWRRLLDRANQPTRLALTQDARMALLADGRRVAPTVLNGDMAVFILSHRPSELRLVSRSAVPLELGTARDARELGVAFEWLAVRKGARCRMIAADDARLTEGFHPFEAGEGIRWTNGDALLPGELLAGFRGEFEVAINLRGATQYIDDGEVLLAA